MRLAGESDPALARAALKGLTAYADAVRPEPAEPRPEIARVGGAALRDHGGSGPPVVLIPSLINPPNILDLDRETSLAGAVAGMGRRALLLDWGEARGRAMLDVSAHVGEVLVPLIGAVGERAALVGYCLGGTMALAAANLLPVERVATLAAPWHFARYPDDARSALQTMWREARPAARGFGALPMEVLQAAFWSLDPARTVAKFAEFASLERGGAKARRFAALEDWANEGEALPFPAARELIEDLFGADLPGAGTWTIGGRRIVEALDVPVLHLTAANDRIAPAGTAPVGATRDIAAGHVGMVVGSARAMLHAELADFLRA